MMALAPKDFPFSFQHKLTWGDFDMLKHVNNVLHFRLFESARVEMVRALDALGASRRPRPDPLQLHAMYEGTDENAFKGDTNFVAAHVDCAFLKPVEEEGLNDFLDVRSRCVNVGRSSARIQHGVFFHGVLVSVGHSTIVNIDGTSGKSAALAPEFLNKGASPVESFLFEVNSHIHSARAPGRAAAPAAQTLGYNEDFIAPSSPPSHAPSIRSWSWRSHLRRDQTKSARCLCTHTSQHP